MTQYLSPLFGEFADDLSIARTASDQAGYLCQPVQTQDGTNLYLAPGPRGIWAWRTAWAAGAVSGSIGPAGLTIMEDGILSLPWPTVAGTYWVVGRYAYVQGSFDNDGNPTGAFGTTQKAVYAIEPAPSNFLGTGTAALPQLLNGQPDSNGRNGTILGRVVIGSGSQTFTWEPSSLTDLGQMAVAQAQMEAELASHTSELATLSGEITAGVVPIGTVLPFAAPAAPTGFLLCNGAAVSRTTYAALYGLIGMTYGIGDGATTFNLPNLGGRFPLGVGASTAPGATSHALAEAGGEETHTLTTAEIPSHSHAVAPYAGGSPASQHINAGINSDVGGSTTGSTGGGGAHNTLPPFLTLNFIIKT